MTTMPDEVFQGVFDVLSRCKRVLLTTHVKPDGDALGSTAAMALALKTKRIESKVLLLSHLPRKYGFIYHENDIPFFRCGSRLAGRFCRWTNSMRWW